MPKKLTHKKQYLVWLDILGFDQLAEDIEKKTGIEARKVRTDFRKVISDRMETVEDNGLILGKKEGSDDWLIVTDSLNKVFKLIHEVLDHTTFYRDYHRVPLEIAIGTGEYDKWASFQGSKLVIEDDTIEFLKTYIVRHYRDWYKSRYRDSIKSTFIILTESAHEDLRPLDKRTCETLIYEFGEGEKRRPIRFFAADVEKFLLKGKGLNFSKEIGYPDKEDYSRIYDLYVPPIGYEDIQKTLEEKKIVFITGTPEYGKTYTAVRLMWDYYTQDYEPVWHKGGDERQRTDVMERLQQIGSELRKGRIIYFEDPFGKTMYESSEGLKREIGVIIDRVRQANGVFVIITSREEVFKEFEREKLSVTDSKEFEQRLNLKRPSYDYERRKEILLRRAEEEGCVWFRDESLKESVLREIEKWKLPTPMNIRDFAIASAQVNEEKKLMKIIQVKSEETARVFAREILAMPEDRQLFLTFPFIGHIPLNDAMEAYKKLVDRCKTNHPWSFEDVFNWFKKDKIQTSNGSRPAKDFIQFSHPSYSEALKYLLEGDNRFKEIFSMSLLNLSERNETAWAVARAVAGNFERLPKEVQDLLSKLAERRDMFGRCIFADDVALAVAMNFEKLPEGVRNQLLLKLSKINEAATGVVHAVVTNFERLPAEIQNLLFKFAEMDASAGAVAMHMVGNFERFPEEIRNQLLLKAAETATKPVVENFEGLPKDVRDSLPSLLWQSFHYKGAAAISVAFAVAINFEKSPEKLRNFLPKLLERDEVARFLANQSKHGEGKAKVLLSKLPEEVRKRLEPFL